MKPFVNNFLSSLLALVVFSILSVMLIFGIISAVSKGLTEDEVAVENSSVLRLNLNYSIVEQTQSGMPGGLALLGLEPDNGMGLNDILANIEHAKTDPKIKGIYVQMGISPNGYATLQEIRDALEDFKKESNKFVIAYGEVIGQSAYYLGSVADKVYMHPSGALDFKGLSAQLTFYKGALDKLGVQTQIFYDGKFKSATEPYRMDKMSAENRLQLETFLNGLFTANLSEITSSRKLDVAQCKTIADSLLAWYPSEAVRLGLLDGLKYYDEVETEMKKRCGIDEEKNLQLVSMTDYRDSYTLQTTEADQGRIAVVYADGTIIDGKGGNGFIGSVDFTEMMRKVRTDKTIKAVVIRVNSPGGSAVASDVMWREIEITKAVKPVVVSMGDYAASGGYMISCNASKIYAQPNTLTGSIGVFLIVPQISDLMENKLGITFDTAQTSTYADFPSITRPFSTRESTILQSGVDSTYLHFKQMVANGRKMPIEKVEEIAQGRIWIGEDAKSIGLVDEIGGIDEAIKGAATLAGMKTWFIREFPEQKESILDQVVQNITQETKVQMQAEQLGILYPHYINLKQLLERPVMQARMPYELEIN